MMEIRRDAEGIYAIGHADNKVECALMTSTCVTFANGLKHICGYGGHTKIKSGLFAFMYDEQDCPENVRVLVETLWLGMQGLVRDYPNSFKLTESDAYIDSDVINAKRNNTESD